MARIRPSASPMLFHCAGSLQMQELFPESEDSEAAREGTAAHWVASSVLEQYPKASGVLLSSDLLGKVSPNGVVIDDVMIESADLYVDHVLKICQQHGALQLMRVEETMQIPRIHSTECGGTPDLWLWSESKNILHVWDFKHGHGVVEAFENMQLIEYTVGILDQVTGGQALTADVIVHMHIVQPRAYHADGSVRTWIVDAVDLRAIVNILISQSELALRPNPPTKSGDHCKYCTGIAHCQTAQRASANAIDLTQQMTVEMIQPEALALHREILKRAMNAIKDRLTGVDSEIETLIKKNVTINGLALDNPPGRLSWSKPDAEIIELAKMMGADLTTIKCVTPTQAAKHLDQTLIDAYSYRPAGKTKIVDSKNTRALRVFAKQKVL